MESPKTVADSFRDLKVLVAEDNLINQKVIRIILERSGCNYEIAKDGIEALSKFESSDYSLVLMDCQMPNLDGLQTCIKIRELESKRNSRRCPIVAMTANTMSGDKERCLSSGMDAFLAKPFKSQELVEVIKLWTKKQN